MDTTLTLFGIIALAALVHSSFQLSISVLTLVSGRSLSVKMSHAKQLRLTTSFVTGASIMTILLLSFAALLLGYYTAPGNDTLLWIVLCGLLLSLGIAVWLFYYRKDRGTSLWVPRGMAGMLARRAGRTASSAEALSLGMTSVLAELLFIIAPVAVAAFAIIHLPTAWQPLGILAYTVISLSTLIVVWMLVGSGHKLSAIQKWRETHKAFLQFAAGSGLLILGFYIYVNEVLALSEGMLL